MRAVLGSLLYKQEGTQQNSPLVLRTTTPMQPPYTNTRATVGSYCMKYDSMIGIHSY